MPDYDPQVSRQQGEEQIRSGLSVEQQVQREMEQRFGPAPPASKTLFEAGMQGAAEMKEEGDYRGYLSMLNNVQQKMVELTRIQRKESDNYLKNLREIERYNSKSLKSEMDHFNLMKNRRQVSKDLNDLQKVGYENLKQEQQVRVKQYQSDVAQAKAMTQQGVAPSVIASRGIGTSPADLIGQGQGNLFARWSTRGGVRGYLGRQGMETAGALEGADLMHPGTLMGIARANPIVAGATAGFFALRGMNEGRGLYVPGVGSVPFTDWQSQLAAGQVTGEGYGAGIASRFEGLRMGINPFDQVSMQVANAIVSAVRGQGFRGAMAREFENSIKDIYKDTGLPVEQIAQMGELYARTGHIEDFRSQMKQLDNVARQTNASVASVAQSMQAFTESLVGQGGARNTPLVGAMTATVSRLAQGNAQFAQQYTTFFQQAGQTYTGLTPAVSQTPFGQRMMRQRLGSILPMLRQEISGMPQDRQSVLLGQMIDANIVPGVTSPDALRRLIMHGPGAIRDVNNQVAQSRMNTFFGRAEGAQRRTHHDPSFLGRALRTGIWGFDVGGHHVPLSGAIDAIPGLSHIPGFGRPHDDPSAERMAYVASLSHSLRGTKLSHAQQEEILRPIRRLSRGESVDYHGKSLDWESAVHLARTRAEHYTSRAQRGDHTIVLRLDSAETRRILGGKSISRAVQLEHATEGAARYVGTAFSEANPF